MRLIAAAVVLGGIFGSASAEVVTIEDGVMTVDISVEVRGEPGAVVAHLVFEEERDLTLPLLDRGDSIFGIRTELEPKNYSVVFEVVGEGSSDPMTLTQLGADLLPGSDGPEVTAPGGDGLSSESVGLLWLAIALGAASLSVLAFWVLGGRDADETGGSGSDEEE